MEIKIQTDQNIEERQKKSCRRGKILIGGYLYYTHTAVSIHHTAINSLRPNLCKCTTVGLDCAPPSGCRGMKIVYVEYLVHCIFLLFVALRVYLPCVSSLGMSSIW